MSEIETMDILETQSLSRETLLESLSLQLMRENLTYQILNQTSSTTDFLATIRMKFDAILQEDSIEDEDKKELKDQIIDFCHDIAKSIANQYGFYINIISDDYETAFDVLYTTYQFFILNKSSNVERFLINYIERYKSSIIENMDLNLKGKGITALSNKKMDVDKNNIHILSNLNKIIEDIRIGGFVEPEEFLSIIDEGEYYTHRMIELYTEQTLMGNFTNALLTAVLGECHDGNELTRIRNEIRIHFYKQ